MGVWINLCANNIGGRFSRNFPTCGIIGSPINRSTLWVALGSQYSGKLRVAWQSAILRAALLPCQDPRYEAMPSVVHLTVGVKNRPSGHDRLSTGRNMTSQRNGGTFASNILVVSYYEFIRLRTKVASMRLKGLTQC